MPGASISRAELLLFRACLVKCACPAQAKAKQHQQQQMQRQEQPAGAAAGAGFWGCVLRIFLFSKRGLFNKGQYLVNGAGAPCELLVFTAFALLLFTVALRPSLLHAFILIL